MSDQFPPDMLDEMLGEQTADEDGLIEEVDLVDAREDVARLAESYATLDDSADQPSEKTSYEEYVEQGKLARKQMDGGKWKLCRIAAALVVDYNENTLGEWAADIGIGASTARHYRRMALFYEYAEWLAFVDQHTQHNDCNVYFSHFGQALVLPTPALAYEWLAIVSGGNWSVDVAGAELQKWIQLKGYEKRNPGKQSKSSKVELCKNVGVIRPSFSQLNGEWFVSFRITDDEEIIKALETLLKNNKNQPLRMTLTKVV